MIIPTWVQEQLRREHDGRFRLRWSSALQTVLLEEKVARGVTTPPETLVRKCRRLEARMPGITEEKLQQARDGYLQFLDCRPGGFAPCPACGRRLQLQPQVWAYAHCAACGKDSPIVAIEPGPALLERLRYLDIHRGGDARVLRDVEDAEDARVRAASRERRATLEDLVKDRYKAIVDIPQVGYGPKTTQGDGTRL